MSYLLPRLGAGQYQHVTSAQLRQAGINGRTVSRWLASGRLVRVHHGVYAVGPPGQDSRSRAAAALLVGGERSALWRRSAAALWGLSVSWPARPELIISVDRRPPGLTVHRSRTLRRRDVTVIDDLRVTSAARTVLDLAAVLNASRLRRVVDELRVKRALSTEALVDVVARNTMHPGAAALKRGLGSAQREPTRSELERVFLRLLADNDLPTPQINMVLCGYRVDAYFPDQQLVVELDGWATHQTRAAFARDRRQDAEILARTGIATVRLTFEQTTRGASRTVQLLQSLL